MFGLRGGTLWITKWAAAAPSRPPTSTPPAAASPAFQNGLAIAGDYMSAASFLGISARDGQRL
jgi:cation/acetate symporter